MKFSISENCVLPDVEFYKRNHQILVLLCQKDDQFIRSSDQFIKSLEKPSDHWGCYMLMIDIQYSLIHSSILHACFSLVARARVCVCMDTYMHAKV